MALDKVVILLGVLTFSELAHGGNFSGYGELLYDKGTEAWFTVTSAGDATTDSQKLCVTHGALASDATATIIYWDDTSGSEMIKTLAGTVTYDAGDASVDFLQMVFTKTGTSGDIAIVKVTGLTLANTDKYSFITGTCNSSALSSATAYTEADKVAVSGAKYESGKLSLKVTPEGASALTYADANDYISILLLPKVASGDNKTSDFTLGSDGTETAPAHFVGAATTFAADTDSDLATLAPGGSAAADKITYYKVGAASGNTTGLTTVTHEFRILSTVLAAGENIQITCTIPAGKYDLFVGASDSATAGEFWRAVDSTEIEAKESSSSAAKGISAIAGILFAMLY